VELSVTYSKNIPHVLRENNFLKVYGKPNIGTEYTRLIN